jgi:hypothetical protein
MRASTAGWLAIVLVFICLPGDSLAQLKSLETERLKLIYIDPTQTYLTPHAARCFESSMDFQTSFFDFEPSEPVTVILRDTADFGGGSAGVTPRNNLSVEIAPLSFAFETMPPGERMTTIMNHELVHLVSMDQAAGSDLTFRRAFRGKVLPTPDHPETIGYLYLTAPRMAVPSWYQEGSAVFMETWMAGGLGRAQGAYDEMVFRSMVRDSSHFYDPLGLVSEGTKVDFQVGINAYLYGTRFFSYLAHEYSPESVVRWISRTEGSRKYYASQFVEIFGMPLRDAWRDWIAWEHEFQQANLDAIRVYPTTPYEDLSEQALGSVSPAYFDPDTLKVYAAFNYPGVVAHVGAISVNDGSVERIVDVKGPAIYTVTALTYDPESKTIFYTTDNSAFRDLRAVDPGTKKSRMLIRDVRIGDLVFNRVDRSVWGVRHYDGIATLVRIPPPYDDWYQVHSWPYGEVIYDLDISPDGRLLSTSMAMIDGNHTVRVFEIEALKNGDVTPIADVDFASSIPNDFVFSADGRYLYGSSYYTGVSNIFRYELATDEIEAVSNCETGFFRPIPLAEDSLLVFRYTGEGFVPALIEAKPLEDVAAITFLGQQIVEKHPVVKQWVPESPADIPLDERIESHGDYEGIKKVKLESIYPIVEGYKDFGAVGFNADFSDPLFLNRFSLTTSYTPDRGLPSDERIHFHLKYQRRRLEADLKINDADFYDLFGPTKVSRKGQSVGFGYNRSLIYDQPRALDLNLRTAYYRDLEQLPRYQNIPATFDELLEASAKLSYRNMRASLGAVDWEKGIKAEAIVGANLVEDDLIPGFIGNFDFGLALPFGHSSIWLRNSFGAAYGELDDVFSNFYFGGFGNNWVDHRSIKRYHEFYSFPGLDLNEVPGRNFVKTTLELNLPPLRFRRVGTPGFYFSWARFSLFTSGLRTNFDEESVKREVGNVGGQVDFRFTVLSKLDMTLSAGYAVAYERDMASKDEVMASLKILR